LASLVRSPSAAARLARARAWLAARAPAEEVLVVAASPVAANDLLRSVAAEAGAYFGWHRATLGRLAADLARPALAERGLVPIGALGVETLLARVVHELGAAAALGRTTEVASSPGFARAAAASVEEVRLARSVHDGLAQEAPELARLLAHYERALADAGLADRAEVFALACEAASDTGSRQPLLGLPLLLLDVPVWTAAEEALLRALAARAAEALATVPAGDAETEARLGRAGFRLERAAEPADGTLARLRAHLFEESAPPLAEADDALVILSAPGESRECVEIARQLLAAAREGTPFDRMAVLLRSPDEYRPHLEEAFARAGIPAHFARGTRRPDPAGRAFVALLACATEGLSARRFAEYLSLGELPDADARGEPPPARPADERFVSPDEELVPEAVAEALAAERAEDEPSPSAADVDPSAPVVAGTLRAPRRWEQLLVDAAVIGGRERWQRRLAGLAHERRLDLEELEDPEGAAADVVRRDLADLAALSAFALPLLDELAALPPRARWGEWIARLSALATRALRRPERVLATLAELAPLARVDGVGLREVRLVLSRRLLEVAVPSPKSRYGRVFVAPAEAARGLAFDVVVVPGLAEKLFPREIREDPLLLDRARAGLGLPTNLQRVRRERLALRLACGAVRRRLVLSYPRLDLEKGRPRVPSFYSLEVLRAGEGRLPGFTELGQRAEAVVEARVGWPAPARPDDAIDDAEHDLALLDGLLRLDPGRSIGTARYLVSANPHLGRALRFRARRWLRRWTPADGLVEPSAAGAAALGAHQLPARSYSATALEHHAACPYKFFLQAVQRLAPREMPEPIDALDPRSRGSLVHEVQYELFRTLASEGLLPVGPGNLAAAQAHLDRALDAVAERFREELAPAIERVWRDGVASVRADLREWLRRLARDTAGFVPSHFELAFGLGSRRKRDPSSRAEDVPLDAGLRLRGSIDLVERDAARRVRVTDHKTGKVRLREDGVFAGGSILQPLLYALAAEKLFPGDEVTEGRLSYCTAAGGFELRSVALDATARESARALAAALDAALREGFLPAYPAKRACDFCDYRVVCGRYEELRTERKPEGPGALAALRKLREMP